MFNLSFENAKCLYKRGVSMKKKVLSAIISMAVLVGAIPGLPVLAATQCTITFETGGLYTQPDAQTVTAGNTGTRPSAPTLYTHSTNYEIDGTMFHNWYTVPASQLTSYSDVSTEASKGGRIFDSNYTIEDDITIYAVSECVVTLDAVNKSSAETAGGSVKYQNVYFNGEQTGEGSYTAIVGTSATVTAVPAEGYSFVCWSTTNDVSKSVSTAAEYTFTVSGRTSLYAIFEKTENVTLTVKWTSTDENSLSEIPALTYTVPKGTTIDTALSGLPTDADKNPIAFEKDGYTSSGLYLPKSIASYETYDGIYNETVSFADTIDADTTIYYAMLQPVDNLVLTAAKPVDGKNSGTELAVSVPDGAHYSTSLNGKSLCSWIIAKDDENAVVDPETERTTTTFVGGHSYEAYLGVQPEVGWCFTLGTTATLNGESIEDFEASSFYGYGTAQLAAEKAADASDDDKPANEQPTDSGLYFENGDLEKLWNIFDQTWMVSYIGSDGQTHWQPGTNTDSIFHVLSLDGKISVDNLDRVTITNDATGAAVQLDTGKGSEGSSVTSDASDVTLVKADGTIAGEARTGSIIIDLYPSYLNSLKPGDYTLTAYLKDGRSVSTKFSVYEGDATKAAAAVPSTGESVSYTTIVGGALVCVSVLSVALFLDKKRLGKKDVK